MSFIGQFRNIRESDKSKAIEVLITNSTPDYSFFLLVLLSVLMATFGLLLDIVAIVIGSMLIAPILYPILSLSLGIVMSNKKVMNRASYTVLKSVAMGVAAAFIVTIFFDGSGQISPSEIISRTEPSLAYLLVAFIAGIAVSYTLVRPGMTETLPGVAVSVAIIPPLAVVGIGVARVDPDIVIGSIVLLGLNIVGIIFASLLSFSLFDFYVKQKVAVTTIKKEDVRVEREKKKAEALESSEE
jgi:uncharacterized hydrophobic protein (TIGR00271 family)